MTGDISRVSVWKNALTKTQIRAMMLMNWTTMAADNDNFTDSDCIGWWEFAAGTGTTNAVVDSSSQSNTGTLTGDWADAGTFTEETGKVTFSKSGTAKLHCKNDFDFYDWTINSGCTVQMNAVGPSSGIDIIPNRHLDVQGTLTSAGDERINIMNTHTDTNSGVFTVADGTKDTSVVGIHTLKSIHTDGTFTMPSATFRYVALQGGAGGDPNVTKLGGDVSVSTTMYVANGNSITTDGYDLTLKNLEGVTGGIVNVDKASSLLFSDVSGCGLVRNGAAYNFQGSKSHGFFHDDHEIRVASYTKKLGYAGSGGLSFTVSMWIQPSAVTSSGYYFLTTNSNPITLRRSGTRIIADFNTDAGNESVQSDVTAINTIGNWYHLAVSYDRTTKVTTFYVNGSIVGSPASALTNTVDNSTTPYLRLGSYGGSGNFAQGQIADMRLFEKVLEAGDISTLYNSGGVTGNPAISKSNTYADSDNALGAAAWWKMDESSGTSVADSAGSYTGTAAGASSGSGGTWNRITVDTAAVGAPGASANYWDADTEGAFTADYTTFKYAGGFLTRGAIDADNCTFQFCGNNGDNGIYLNGAITSFTNNIIDQCSYDNISTAAFVPRTSHTGFENITISNTVGAALDIRTYGGGLVHEFVNSSFDINTIINGTRDAN